MAGVAQVTYPISEASETTGLGAEAREFLGHRKQSVFNQARGYGFWDWATVFLPCIAWLRKYNFRHNLLVRLIPPPPLPRLPRDWMQLVKHHMDLTVAYA